jgi:osmotically-inducible protein OsmY
MFAFARKPLRRMAASCAAFALGTGLPSSSLAQPPGVRAEQAPDLPGLRDFHACNAVLHRLADDKHLEAKNILVTSRDGIVTLAGSVTVLAWRERAARVAKTARNVRAVINRIRVTAVQKSDRQLAKDARDALRATAALRSMPIRVRARAGVVELKGAITTWDEQQLAEAVVSAVPGVRFCLNQLVASSRIARSSSVVAADVTSRLDWDPLLIGSSVECAAKRDSVFLSGNVENEAQRQRATVLALVKGVTRVDASQLSIVATDAGLHLRATAPSDTEISAVIPQVMTYWPSVSFGGVSTSVLGGAVMLRGNVPSRSDSDAIEGIVRCVVGVVRVQNELRGAWWRPAPAPRPRAVPPRRRPARGR